MIWQIQTFPFLQFWQGKSFLIKCSIFIEINHFCLLFRAEAIYEKLSRSMYVSNAARRVLKLPLITEQDLHRCKNEVSPMHQNGISPRRRRHQNSGNSESSVEVLPDLETEEQKFENALLAAGPFWKSTKMHTVILSLIHANSSKL